MSRPGLVSAGQRVAVMAPKSFRTAIATAAAERLSQLAGPYDLVLDRLSHTPDLNTFDPVTRGVWVGPEGVLMTSVGGSGYTQLWSPCSDHAGTKGNSTTGSARFRVSSQWSPSLTEFAAAHLLRQRHRTLRAQVLLHYPVLWSALAISGRAPLHVSVLEIEGVPVLLAGPGGVGKSSLVAEALAQGARATCDNLGVSDGHSVYGLVEPLRLPTSATSAGDEPGGGPRAAHGRREHPFTGRLAYLRPAVVMVVRRDDRGTTRLESVPSERAAQEIVAGTYAAGELQRFWPLVAHLALAGFGPVHPPLVEVATKLTQSLPCYELTLGRSQPVPHAYSSRLASLLGQDLLGFGSAAQPPDANGHNAGSRS